MTFKALLATRTAALISTTLVDFDEADLMPGDVTVDIDYSTVNYKDALAISGRAPVVRQLSLIPGIDFAGVVAASSHPGFAVGDRVVANGWGLSQTHHGGYAQRARVSGDWLVKLPESISTRDAMAIGMAGSKLARATQMVGLADVPGLAVPLLEGRVRGRTVVDVNA